MSKKMVIVAMGLVLIGSTASSQSPPGTQEQGSHVLAENPGPEDPSDQQLDNYDIIQMAQGGYSDIEILMAIQVGPVDFVFSFEDLNALREAGVSEEVRLAMMEAEKLDEDAPSEQSAGFSSEVDLSSTIVRRSSAREESGPTVYLLTAQGEVFLPRSITQITQTDAKGNSLGTLATDQAVNAALSQALTTGLTRASWEASKVAGSSIGSFVPYGGLAASAISSLMANRQPKVTFLWALPGQAAEIQVAHPKPVLQVDYGNLAGVSSAQYEPMIVSCMPMSSGWRLIGATRGKANMMSKAKGNWDLFSKFSQERVPVRVTQMEGSAVRLEPVQALPPGQYSVVLRPLNSTQKFAGVDIAQAAGDGMIVNSAWDFGIVAAAAAN